MFGYIGKRLFLTLFVLLGVSALVFVIARIVPGDPVRMALGPTAPESVVEEMKQMLHLDKPIAVQFIYWLRGVAKGDFGMSLTTRRSITLDVKEFLPATLELVLFSSILRAVISLSLGILSAAFKDSWIDNTVRLGAYFGVSIPGFVFAVMFLLIFGYWFPILPVIGRLSQGISVTRITGFMTIDSLMAGNLGAFTDSLKHLLLPAIAMAIGGAAQEARITRSSMVENLNKDYIFMSHAQGVSKGVVLRKYLLKPSLIPTITVFALSTAGTIAGAFITELIFNWPGFARYGVNALLAKDLNVISAVVFVTALAFAFVNLVIDIVVAYLDPRVRLT